MNEVPYYAPHPLAAIFPMMGEADLAALADDIKANGQRDPVVLFEGKILDGRNRFWACGLCGVPPRFETYTGGDPLGFVISKNLNRRHLTDGQRAMAAANIANVRQGERRDIEPSANLQKVSRSEDARMLKVSERTVADAVTVQTKGVPELVAAVESGDVSVSAAAVVAKLPAEVQKNTVKSRTVKQTASAKRKSKPARKAPPGRHVPPDHASNDVADDEVPPTPPPAGSATPEASVFGSPGESRKVLDELVLDLAEGLGEAATQLRMQSVDRDGPDPAVVRDIIDGVRQFLDRFERDLPPSPHTATGGTIT